MIRRDAWVTDPHGVSHHLTNTSTYRLACGDSVYLAGPHPWTHGWQYLDDAAPVVSCLRCLGTRP